jgi:2-oxoisovalerate dehydrogenase E1 component
MDLPSELLIEMQRRMLQIRCFDEQAAALQAKGLIPGPVHTSIGHEAAVVGACAAVRSDDYMTGFHRSHGHPIGKGSPLAPLMAELFGRATGICKGKGGSMHLADFSVGSLGESGIVGAGMPIAVGAGLSAKMRGTDQVSLCFFGDGAANCGPFHESLNLASIWNVPVVFLCENNEYAITFSIKNAMKVENVADRASSYAIPGVVVDGQDVLAVYDAVAAAVARAREGGGPTLIEAKTYRYRDHAEFGGLVVRYRSDEEVERWRQRDPIALFRDELIARDVLDTASADRLEAEVAAEVDEAIEFARNSPLPEVSDMLDDLFVHDRRDARTPSSPNVPETASQMTFLAASSAAIAEEMRRDSSVFFMGEDMRAGLYGDFPVAEFEEWRVRDLPISENGFVGAGVGAAMTGMRPVIHMGFSTFLYSAMDQIVNQAAKLRYMSGGQASVPLTLVVPAFYSGGIAAHHSDRPFALFANSPGLKIVAPSTPQDVAGLTTAAIREDDTVLIFVDGTLWGLRGPVGDIGDHVVPLGLADIKREGSDVTVVGIAGGVSLALAAAAALEADDISVEVIDPRSLVPLDHATIIASVEKTRRLVVVDPAPLTCSFASEIVATVTERCQLRAFPVRVTGANVPTPYSPPLERHSVPDAARVAEAVRRAMSSACDAVEVSAS